MSFDILGTSCDQCEARFNKSHIRKVYACLAVTCHCTFGRMTGIFTCTCGNTGVETDTEISQHRKSTLEKKILPPFQQGFEPATLSITSPVL